MNEHGERAALFFTIVITVLIGWTAFSAIFVFNHIDSQADRVIERSTEAR